MDELVECERPAVHGREQAADVLEQPAQPVHDLRAKPGVLALMYWGASIMWFVDAVVEYAELKSEYFTPAPADMLNDSFLGFSVVALGLIIWLVIVMIKDPRGVIRKKN